MLPFLDILYYIRIRRHVHCFVGSFRVFCGSYQSNDTLHSRFVVGEGNQRQYVPYLFFSLLNLVSVSLVLPLQLPVNES